MIRVHYEYFTDKEKNPVLLLSIISHQLWIITRLPHRNDKESNLTLKSLLVLKNVGEKKSCQRLTKTTNNKVIPVIIRTFLQLKICENVISQEQPIQRLILSTASVSPLMVWRRACLLTPTSFDTFMVELATKLLHPTFTGLVSLTRGSGTLWTCG